MTLSYMSGLSILLKMTLFLTWSVLSTASKIHMTSNWLFMRYHPPEHKGEATYSICKNDSGYSLSYEEIIIKGHTLVHGMNVAQYNDSMSSSKMLSVRTLSRRFIRLINLLWIWCSFSWKVVRFFLGAFYRRFNKNILWLDCRKLYFFLILALTLSVGQGSLHQISDTRYVYFMQIICPLLYVWIMILSLFRPEMQHVECRWSGHFL
jgi:hypothetical protein